MIVTIHPSVANRYPTVDTDFPIQAFKCSHVPAYKLLGSQLMAAGVHTIKSTGMPVFRDKWYYMALKDVVPVKYIKLSLYAQFIVGYKVPGKMRVIPFAPDPYDDELYYRVTNADAKAAGVPPATADGLTMSDGMVYIKKSMSRVIREG